MGPSLLYPPARLTPDEALALAQQAPAVLRRLPSGGTGTGTGSSSVGGGGVRSVVALLQSVLKPAESNEVWVTYENLLMSCLRTGDLASARECVRRLVARFGDDNERVVGLEGLVREAEATDRKGLEAVLASYDAILSKDDTNVPVHKRRIALLRSLGRVPEAATALLALLDFSPTDAEAWAELADLYLGQGLYAQAIFALEEVLVLAPNAWNIHARLGEVEYMAASTAAGGSEAASQTHAAAALKRFCRSIELCDDYLRGYYGLKVVTSYILGHAAEWSKQAGGRRPDGDVALPDTATVQRLAQAATDKLAEIVRRSAAKEPHWSGYDAAEVAAARALLADETAPVVR